MLQQTPTIDKQLDRTVITLPKRDIKEIAKWGWIGIVFGSFSLLFGVAWVSMPLMMAFNALKQGGLIFPIFPIVFVSFSLPIFYFAAKALAIGIGVLKNDTWTSISISPHRFVITEHFWKLTWKRKFKKLPSNNLVIDSLRQKRGNHNAAPMPFGLSKELFGLGAKQERTVKKRQSLKPVPLLIGYERHVIDTVVEALQREISLGTLNVESKATGDDGNVIASAVPKASQLIVEDLQEETDSSKPIEKPSDTIITVEQIGDATIFRVPPIGIMKVGALLWFSIIWLVFCIGIFSGVFYAEFAGNNKDFPLWFAIPFALVFVSAGVGMFVAAINVGRRSSVLGVANGLLWIERISIFGKKTMHYEKENIQSIAMLPSGTEVNNVPVMELQIKANGETIGMLSQFSELEIEWLTDSLRRLLNVPRNKSGGFAIDAVANSALQDPASIPSSWRISVEESNSAIRIEVLPKSYWSMISSTLFSLVFMGASGFMIYTGIIDFDLFLVPFGLVFGAVGVGVFCLSCSYMRRGFEFEMGLKTLVAQRKRLTGVDRFEFAHSDIAKIHGGDGSFKINNEPQPLLEIVRVDGSREAFLMWRKPALVLFVIAKLNAFREANRLVENEKSTQSTF